ncbi:hypothetical protein AKO1_006190 [Acrasis kona]|uniref:Endonuclease/exonuclease/phosphatase domain-containing protein n=1 Tax=Acrasis kona TaxID=1008807 RepID=A0AAW2YIQ7_9EUKA
MPRSTFRVATLNIHMWGDVKNKDNVERLIEFIRPFDLDLIAIQEVMNIKNKLKTLADGIGMPYVAFGEGCSDRFGNAIISKHPFAEETNQISTFKEAEERAMLSVKLDSKHPFIQDNKDVQFHSIHLDHSREEYRMAQLIDIFSQTTPSSKDFIMGDFNALDETDYSEDYFNQIAAVRRKGHWESPKSEVTSFMKNEKYIDVWRTLNPDSLDISTCRFNTRIDYIWQRGHLSKKWRISNCNIIPSKKITDHELVLCVFEQVQS